MLAVDDILQNLKRKVEPKKPAPKISPNNTPKAAIAKNRAKTQFKDQSQSWKSEKTEKDGPVLPKQELTKPLNQYNRWKHFGQEDHSSCSKMLKPMLAYGEKYCGNQDVANREPTKRLGKNRV